MNFIYTSEFKIALNEIKNFIALDSPNKAIKFRDELYEKSMVLILCLNAAAKAR